jgi:hypothetical protein
MDVKPEDQGVYTCTANSSAGMITANATLKLLGKFVREHEGESRIMIDFVKNQLVS